MGAYRVVFTLLGGCLMLLFSCRHNPNQKIIGVTDEASSKFNVSRVSQSTEALKTVSLFEKGNGSVNIDSIIKDNEYIFLETNENSLIGSADKVVFSDKKIFVLDVKISKTLFVFDISGKFLYKISNKVDAIDPDDFCVVKDTIYLLTKRRFVYRYQVSTGAFQSGVRLPFYASSIAPEDLKGISFNFYTSKEGSVDTLGHWVVNVDLSEGKVRYKDIPKKSNEFYPRSHFSLFFDGGNTFFTKSFNDTIYTIKGNVISPLASLSFPNKQLKSEILSREVSKKGNVYRRLAESEYLVDIGNIASTDDWLYITYFPKDIVRHAFINKNNYQLIDVKSVLDHKYMGALKIIPIGTHNNKFVFRIETNELYDRVLQLNKRKINTKSFKEARFLAKKIKYNDNPILVLASP